MALFADKVSKRWTWLCVICTQNPALHTKVVMSQKVMVCPQAFSEKNIRFFPDTSMYINRGK